MQFTRWIKKQIPVKLRALLKQLTNRDRIYSYSQFGEDAYLSAYFKGKTWILNKPMSLPKNGFYVDIGAYSPTECSNTYAFYKHGWRGINIDATPGVIGSFDLLHSRDTNLNLAIGSKSEDIVFFSWGTPCVFNTADPVLAKERSDMLGARATETTVKCITLAELLDTYLPKNMKIDFMTIDVEGLDFDVLKSNNWDHYRPELIVAEVYADDIKQLVNAELFQFMQAQSYECIAWLKPSIIFRDIHAIPE